MVLKLRKKKNLLILSLISLGIVFLFFSYQESNQQITQLHSSNENQAPRHPPLNSISADVSLPTARCSVGKLKYNDLSQLKKENPPLFRFSNIHKKIGGTIYRLRHFFKDGDEGEIETFLVYQEDQNETPSIVEKSHYNKGKLYKKIEDSTGELLYQEEGYNLEQDTFLHYINGKLSSIHSQSEECQY